MESGFISPAKRTNLKSYRETSQEYLAQLRMAGRSDNTLTTYRNILNLFVAGGIQAVFPEGEKLAPATRRLRYLALRGFFRWAIRMGYTEHDPLEGMSAPRLPATQPRAVTADDLERLKRVVVGLPLPHRAFFTLLVETGLRQGEAVALRIRDVDLYTAGREGLHVRGKGGHERFVPLPPGYESRRLLRRLIGNRSGDSPLFSRDGDAPWTTSAVRKMWAAVCAQAGVKGYSVHSLRHTAATRLVERLGDLVLAQCLLGHASVATTARYAARSDDALREAMDRVGGGWQR